MQKRKTKAYKLKNEFHIITVLKFYLFMRYGHGNGTWVKSLSWSLGLFPYGELPREDQNHIQLKIPRFSVNLKENTPFFFFFSPSPFFVSIILSSGKLRWTGKYRNSKNFIKKSVKISPWLLCPRMESPLQLGFSQLGDFLSCSKLHTSLWSLGTYCFCHFWSQSCFIIASLSSIQLPPQDAKPAFVLWFSPACHVL